jgi:hypothetical protein
MPLALYFRHIFRREFGLPGGSAPDFNLLSQLTNILLYEQKKRKRPREKISRNNEESILFAGVDEPLFHSL